ncbi:MAG TPA: amino acid adenylation domain-containing protein [Blastocatellia bacterium]|nr:amino acid adenylation domain-containing protein [Blastocatellia bacterium]
MLRETVDWFVSTGQQPLPVQAFSVREAGEGFRLMARANHIGKVAFKVEGEAIDTTTVSGRGLSLSEEGTYLITGGLGGLGLSVAEWMVDRGARHIVLAGRSEGSAEAQSKVQALGKLAEISSVRVDISDRKETASLLQSIERGVWPLKGVVHAAGVLDDGILTQLDRSRFETVFASKIGGAWNLHSLTRECQLDFFVMFSSAASLLGSSGQANYSAANAFLDSLAHYRRSLGLPGLSINWGAWARVGLAATDYRTRRLAQRGLNGIEPEQGLEALEQLLQDNCPQVAVMDLDMGAWERHYPAATESPYFEALVRHREPNQALTRPAAETQGEAVIGMDPLARRAMMLDRLGELAAEILGYGARRSQSLDLNQPMNKLGLDSLMAVELKGRIAASFGITVPVIDFLKGASLAQLVDQVHDALEARLADKLDAPEGEGVDSTGNGTPRPLALHQKDPLASAPSSIVCDETNRYAPFPLTDIQEAFWVGRGDGVELGGVACHAYYEVDATGLDLRKFKLAFQKLIDRHDMLRAIVLADGSQQVLATVPEYEIEYVDLSSHGAAELGSALESIRSRLSHQVLPADRWPLFEIRASGLTGERIRLHFSFDILIADVASLRILFREWARLYSDIDAELPPLTLTYRDYVLAASAARDSDEFTRSRQYWTNRLAELPSAPELPLHVRPDLIARPRFVRNMGRLDPPRWSRLKELAGEFGLTPSGVLLAAFAEVLAKWSRNPRFTLNVTLMNRVPIHPQVNEIIGDFTVSIPLAVDTSLPEPFRERARRIHLQLLEDIDHGAVSGVRIARDLAKARGTGPVALMPVVFTSLVGQPAGDGADRTLWMGETVYGISQTPQVWLDHQVLEENGGLVFNWDAVDELFPDGLLDEIFQCYSRLLDSLSQEERNWDRHMPALVPAALDAIPLSNFDPTPVPRVLLHNLIADQARKHPQKAAILTEAESISYEELDRRADHLSVELRKRGARRNALVAVIMEKGWEQIAAVLGVLKSGAAYLPIDPGLPRERIWRLLGHGEVNIALTQSWIGERMEWPSGTQCLAVDLEPAAPVKYQREACPQDPDDLAYVIYTSGSTGLPKGVMITHAAAANTILDLNHRFDIGEGDTVLAVSSLSFDLSVYDIFGTLAAGGTLVIPSSSLLRDPGHWAELMNRNRVTIWNSVPALMEMLIEYLSGSERALPESLRLVLLSGDWIPPALPGRIKSISDAHVVALGGATEASIWSILFPVDGTWSGAFSIPYGRPMSNQRVYVLNDAMQPCPAWVTGGLYIAGAGLAAGYWRDDERTKASFIQSVTGERLYRTGDLGRYLPDGNIEFLGREDSQVKILGHRIELGEIEFAILRHEAVKAAVVVTEGTPQRKSLVAYVVADRVPEVGVESLRAFLKRSLPGYMVPSRLVIVDKFPLNANGKVDRGALSKLSAVKDEPAQIRVSGNDLLEQRIGACVASVLGMSQVRAETNLIELGANSVDLIKISCMLEKDLKRKLRLTDLYRCATVKELARSYRGQWLADIEPVSPINGGRYQNPETAAVYEEGEL